jgi:putative DNA primase/helicase
MANPLVEDPSLRRFKAPSIERALLGLILIAREVPESLRYLEPGDFCDPLHRAIYAAMCALHAEGQAIDVSMLLHRARRDRKLDGLDDAQLASYLDECLDLRPTPGAEGAYARRLVDLADKRMLCYQALRFVCNLLDGELDDLSAEEVRAHLAAALGTLKAAPAPQCATWADLEGLIGPIEWDWPGWLPRGFLTLLAGEAGLGKSILALRLCACYLRGDDWPDGARRSVALRDVLSHVVWCETEAAQAINWERAKSWGLPLDRILTPLGPLEDVSLDAPAHQAAIARAAHRPEVRLVVVDSFSGASRRGENASERLAAVRWLAALARDTGKAILLLHHLRKRGPPGRVSLERLRGHSSIVQPARTVLALDAPDPYRGGLRRLSVIKSNLAPFPEPLGVWVAAGGEVRFAQAPRAPRPATALERAVEALKELLGDGPAPANEVQAYLQEARIAKRTAERAKAEMGILSRPEKGRWVWELPSNGSGAASRDN